MDFCWWISFLLQRVLLITFRRKYLSDPTEDVRVATENLLADFLREIHDVTIISRQFEHHAKEKYRSSSTLAHRPDLENGHESESDRKSHQGSEPAVNHDVTSELDDQDIGCKCFSSQTSYTVTQLALSMDPRTRC
jgi:hypothetical protein